jgi:Fur family ferric uptake transcriptional regulator
LTFIINKA